MQGFAESIGRRTGIGTGLMELVRRAAEFDVLDWIFHFEAGEEEEWEDEEEMYRILEEAGIDSFAYEYMDDEERADVLEAAGLDPFDFGL